MISKHVWGAEGSTKWNIVDVDQELERYDDATLRDTAVNWQTIRQGTFSRYQMREVKQVRI